MILSLNDPRWMTLSTAYGSACEQVVVWLRQAYAEGVAGDILGNIINEIQHQGDTSEAMYAVAPHLLMLAESAEPSIARQLDIHAGLIHCASQTSNAVQCPDDLKAEFIQSATLGRRRVTEWLQVAEGLDDFKYGVAALAGFVGHGRFGRVLEGIEFFKGQFYYSGLDDPIPEV